MVPIMPEANTQQPAQQQEQVIANRNTTDIAPAQGMHFKSGPDREEGDVSTPNLNPRSDIMASIFAKRNLLLEKELGLASQQTIESDNDGVGDGQQNDQQPQQVSARDDSATDHAPPSKQDQAQAGDHQQAAPRQSEVRQPVTGELPDVIPVNISGTVMNIGRDQLLQLASTGLQAQQVMQDASRMREDAQRLVGAGQQTPQQAQPQQPRAQQNPQDVQPAFDATKAKAIAQRISYGSEDEQAQALVDLGNVIQQAVTQQLQGAQGRQIDPNAIVQQATHQVMALQQQHQTLNTIAEEFKDVFADASLSYAAGYEANLAQMNDARMGRQRPQIEVFREVLSGIRNRYIAPRGTGNQSQQNPGTGQAPAQSVQSATPVAQQMSDRIERKRTAPQPPVAANVRSKGAPEKRYPTNSEIVSQMRKARGQSAF